MLENVTPLIEISDGINTRQSRRRGRNYNQTELDSGNFGQTGSNHADLLGVDQLHGVNIVIIVLTVASLEHRYPWQARVSQKWPTLCFTCSSWKNIDLLLIFWPFIFQ